MTPYMTPETADRIAQLESEGRDHDEIYSQIKTDLTIDMIETYIKWIPPK